MNKNKQKIGYKTQNVKHSFTGTKLTKYAGLSPIMDFINKLKIGEQINELFPTEKTNADKKGAKSYHPLLAFVSSPYRIM